MAATVVVTPADLKKDQDGGVVDFLNDTGAAIPQGSVVQIEGLYGVVHTDEVAEGAIGSLEFEGVQAVYFLPLDTAATDQYKVGVKVSVDVAGNGVPLGTAGEILAPFIALPKADVIKGAAAGDGITSDQGAAAPGDSYIRVGLLIAP